MAEKLTDDVGVPPSAMRARLYKLVHDRTDDAMFQHGDGLDRPTEMGATTRRMCAAAYLDESYARDIVDELLTDSRRAVLPAAGYDLEVVARHGRAALTQFDLRDGLIMMLLFVCFVLRPVGTLWLFGLLLVVQYPGWIRRRRGRWTGGLAVLAVLLGMISTVFLIGFPVIYTIATAVDGLEPFLSIDYGNSFLYLIELVAGLLAVTTWFRRRMIRRIVIRLGPDSAEPAPRSPNVAAEDRFQVIRAAQHGNIVLHEGLDPLVGAGERERTWSIALPLRSRLHGPGETSDALDPVALADHVRRELAALRSAPLPEPERIAGLRVRDQIFPAGLAWGGYELFDSAQRIPYSYATQEAIDAVIRFPQGGAMHLLRVSVGDHEDNAGGAVATVFLHLAVQGKMLYVETIQGILGPLRQGYLDADGYAGGPLLTAALADAWHRLAPTVTGTPARLVRRGVGVLATAAAHSSDRDRRRRLGPLGGYGARRNVREMASRPWAGQPDLQRAEAEKYLRLIVTHIAESIAFYLEANDFDSTEFAAAAAAALYSSGPAAGRRGVAPHD